MYYKFLIRSYCNNIEFKHSYVHKILSNGIEYSLLEYYKTYGNLFAGKEEIDQVHLGIEEDRLPVYNYPNFISVSVSFCAIDSDALTFIQNLNIDHYTVDTIIINDEKHYTVVFFNKEVTVNMEASNLVTLNGKVATKGKTVIDSELVIKCPTKPVIGISHINIRPNLLICDEDTKARLEDSGLTGFIFEEQRCTSSSNAVQNLKI